jgi:hypothetical protein
MEEKVSGLGKIFRAVRPKTSPWAGTGLIDFQLASSFADCKKLRAV